MFLFCAKLFYFTKIINFKKVFDNRVINMYKEPVKKVHVIELGHVVTL